jgi:hypothetical protein
MVDLHRRKEGDAAARAIAAMIRRSSEAGQLISDSEILRRLPDEHFLPSPAAVPGEEIGNILSNGTERHEDIKELVSQDGSREYYSSLHMTEPYARILLQKQGDPLQLIAGIVRQNSAVYPRPVPLEIFTRQPFALTLHQVVDLLERMKAETEYQDIVTTTTSTSKVFLYSTLHLEPDYASMLAEWLDVGQFENP